MSCALLAACDGGTGRPTGNPIPIADTVRVIQGAVAYFTTGPIMNHEPDGRLTPEKGFRNSITPALAPGLIVEIYDINGLKLGEAVTNERGEYSTQVNFGQRGATRVKIKVLGLIRAPGVEVRIWPNRSAAQPYAHLSPNGGDSKQETMTVDVVIDLDEDAAVFHMLNILREGLELARAGITQPLTDLDIYYEPGNGGLSSFRKGPNGGELTIAGGIIGDNTSNVDAWDGPKVMRLFGEHLLAYFWNDTAPAGTANDALLVPSAAWREGFLDFWACQGNNSPEYWDTVGSGPEGRVVRYFHLESFFDPSLPSLGPDDPNVYQDPANVGDSSRFSIAEVLWDIHDEDFPTTGDNDGSDLFPVFVTLRLLEEARPGFSYPYILTLLDAYVADGSMSSNRVKLLLREPEDQGIDYTHPAANWPPLVSPEFLPGGSIRPPFDKTVSDKVDTVNPVPVNLEIGLETQRYFMVDITETGDLTATLTTAGDLVVDILDLNNNVQASGPSPQTATDLATLRYIIRVRPAAGAAPQEAPFDLRIELKAP